MGSYINVDSFPRGILTERELVQLTQDVPSVDTVDTDVLEEAITSAESLVDGYLGARHQLPLVSVPPFVVTLTARIVRYILRGRRGVAVPDAVKDEYNAAIATLRDISKGVVTLGVTPEPAANTERVIRVTSQERVFGRANLTDF